MAGTGKTSWRDERVHVLQENFAENRFNGTSYKDDSHIYEYGVMKYLTNLKNHMIVRLERFMVRSFFALYPGLSRKGIWAIIHGITKDRHHEQ
jgi:hypothetical protein